MQCKWHCIRISFRWDLSEKTNFPAKFVLSHGRTWNFHGNNCHISSRIHLSFYPAFVPWKRTGTRTSCGLMGVREFFNWKSENLKWSSLAKSTKYCNRVFVLWEWFEMESGKFHLWVPHTISPEHPSWLSRKLFVKKVNMRDIRPKSSIRKWNSLPLYRRGKSIKVNSIKIQLG